jgi:hypothetical protein
MPLTNGQETAAEYFQGVADALSKKMPGHLTHCVKSPVYFDTIGLWKGG